MFSSPLLVLAFLTHLAQKGQGATSSMSTSDHKAGVEACFSGGICSIWVDLDFAREKERSVPANYTAYNVCACESGWLSTLQACDDCQEAYEMNPGDLAQSFSTTCSKNGYSIGPIPSSLLASLSSRNATWTGGATAWITPASRRNTSLTQFGMPSKIKSGIPTETFVLTMNGLPTGSVPSVHVAPNLTQGSVAARFADSRINPGPIFILISFLLEAWHFFDAVCRT
ncbi:hypothetical protein K469DRAFT_710439 [Zopfia rhizophila CBS 207.26]|uniref:Uncharacterized protein n=1 Tax=Zopfia rhizophila CBS 207.26 TaxID=1314779 RepID=A0A6A6DZ34_9PEZI|nr:hypothetical protein K469DRAFT_710439 [Zopfia rhizophila CBS 207.26]